MCEIIKPFCETIKGFIDKKGNQQVSEANTEDKIKQDFDKLEDSTQLAASDKVLSSKIIFKEIDKEDNINIGCEVHYARQQGSSHLINEKPCQDYCLANTINEDLLVVAIADGHGDEKYPYSEYGSKFACESVVEATSRFYEEFIVQKQYPLIVFVEELKKRVFKETIANIWNTKALADFKVREPESELKDREAISKYGTTLLFTIVTKEYYIIGQIGDGAILLFKKNAYSQLFKRHNEKFDSKTDSMASSTCVEKLVIDSIKRDLFTNVLMSTDGIYDKIDRGDYFYFYGLSLVEQIEKYKKLEAPFTMSQKYINKDVDLDISALKSCRDDLTIALVCSDLETVNLDFEEIASYGFDNLKFIRAYDGYVIYTAEKDEMSYELHIGNVNALINTKLESIDGYIGNIYDFSLKNDMKMVAYIIPEDTIELQALYEAGELCEKKNLTYWQEKETSVVYTNKFILKTYENLCSLLETLKSNGFYPSLNFADSLRVDMESNVFFCNDFVQFNKENEFAQMRVKNLLEKFNLLGYISTGSIKQPLFKTTLVGKQFYYPHMDFNEKPMGRVYCSKGRYGIQNLSEIVWYVHTDAGNKEVVQNSILGISNGRTFYINSIDDVSRFADVKGDVVCYKIVLFDETGV